MKAATLEKRKPLFHDWFSENATSNVAYQINSIPLYITLINQLSYALGKHSDIYTSVTDLCGGTGVLGANILTKSLFETEYVNIDASMGMIEESKRVLSNFKTARSVNGMIGNVCIENGIIVPQIALEQFSADVMVEILGFQYSTKDRKKIFRDIADNCKVFVCVEKVRNRKFEDNEWLALTEYLEKRLSADEISQYQTIDVRTFPFMIQDDTLKRNLKDYFEHVDKFFQCGNYVGYVATNDYDYSHCLRNSLLECRILKKNKYNASTRN